MCHVSCVTCHGSRVTGQVSPVTSQFFYIVFILKKIGPSGGASRWRVCYQRGLPRLVIVLWKNNIGDILPLLLYRECGEISLCHRLKSPSERSFDDFFFKVMIPIKSILNSKESNMNLEEASEKSKTATTNKKEKKKVISKEIGTLTN